MKDRKSVVYICSKYRGDIETNTRKARRYCRFAAEQGYVPIAPHLFLPQFIDEETERDLALSIGIALLDQCCEEVWVCGSEISEGMAAEIAHARNQNIPIRYFKEEDFLCMRLVKE